MGRGEGSSERASSAMRGRTLAQDLNSVRRGGPVRGAAATVDERPFEARLEEAVLKPLRAAERDWIAWELTRSPHYSSQLIAQLAERLPAAELKEVMRGLDQSQYQRFQHRPHSWLAADRMMLPPLSGDLMLMPPRAGVPVPFDGSARLDWDVVDALTTEAIESGQVDQLLAVAARYQNPEAGNLKRRVERAALEAQATDPDLPLSLELQKQIWQLADDAAKDLVAIGTPELARLVEELDEQQLDAFAIALAASDPGPSREDHAPVPRRNIPPFTHVLAHLITERFVHKIADDKLRQAVLELPAGPGEKRRILQSALTARSFTDAFATPEIETRSRLRRIVGDLIASRSAEVAPGDAGLRRAVEQAIETRRAADPDGAESWRRAIGDMTLERPKMPSSGSLLSQTFFERGMVVSLELWLDAEREAKQAFVRAGLPFSERKFKRALKNLYSLPASDAIAVGRKLEAGSTPTVALGEAICDRIIAEQ